MKVAVAYKDGEVFQSFGHAEEFKIYAVRNDKVIASKVFSAEEKGDDTLILFLHKYMVEAVICGGIGAGDHLALDRFDIAVFSNISGDADQAVEDLLAGKLEQTVVPDCAYSCSEHGCSHPCH